MQIEPDSTCLYLGDDEVAAFERAASPNSPSPIAAGDGCGSSTTPRTIAPSMMERCDSALRRAMPESGSTSSARGGTG